MVLLNALVFMETVKSSKIKNQLTCLQYSTEKGLRISIRQTGSQTSTETKDLHTSTGYAGLLEFTGRSDYEHQEDVQVY